MGSGLDCSLFYFPFEAPYQAQNAFLAVTALRILRIRKVFLTG